MSKIIRDNVSGSYSLLIKINYYLKQNIGNLDLLKESLNQIKLEMKDFQAVQIYVKNLDEILNQKDAAVLEKYLNDFQNSTKDKFFRIYKNLKPFIIGMNNLFTLSNSQTVYEIIKYLSIENKNILVRIAESRPMCEGKILTKKLLKLGLKIKLVLDCQLDESIYNSDLILLGADRILSNGDLVNKVGSKSTSIIAKYYNKPVYVIATENKFSSRKKIREKPKLSGEIWAYHHKNLLIENYYFEIIPRKLITKIITEERIY